MNTRFSWQGACLLSMICFLSACNSTEQSLASGTLWMAVTPTNELEQIYYLGSFDPRGQLPPTIYRVRVRGQASAFSNMDFASGWVPAALIDSLNSSITKTDGKISTDQSADKVSLNIQRRLMQFGPDGFREAPSDHRLVIVMGANPNKFFEGIDLALGQVAGFDSKQQNADLKQKLFAELVRLQSAELEMSAMRQKIEIARREQSK